MSTMGGIRKKLSRYPKVVANKRYEAQLRRYEASAADAANAADEKSDIDQENPVDASPETMERIYSNPDYDGDHDHSMNG